MAKSTKQSANGIKAASSSKPKSKNVSKKSSLSQEKVVDSDSASDDESSSMSSEEQSSTDPDSEAVSSSNNTSKRHTSATGDSASGDVSEANDSEDSDEASVLSSTEPSSSSEDEDDLAAPQQEAEAAKPQPMAETPRHQFVPPSGYTKVEAYNSPAVVDWSSLESKELWHIEVPSGISIGQLSSISCDAMKSQTVVLSHKGSDFIFTEDKEPTNQSSSNLNKALVLPDTTDKSYKSGSSKISRSIRLQPRITMPNLSKRQTETVTGSDAAAQTTRPAVSAIRPQPKGLKMRYKPPGFGSGQPGTIGSDFSADDDSDIDMNDAPPADHVFRLPTITNTQAKSTSQNTDAQSPSQKKRKRPDSKPASQPSPASVPAKEKAKKKGKVVEPTPAAVVADDEGEGEGGDGDRDVSKKMTKEEREARRKRKADRALRRQSSKAGTA